jgi:hypothetical protein
MNKKILPYLCLLCLSALSLLPSSSLSAQTATGSWYGRAEADIAGMHDNYLTELVIKQKGNRVTGVFGYYFRDKYQSFFVHGRYNPQTREVIILNIPVIYYGSNSTVNSIDCNTNFRGVLMNTRFKTSLSGYFYHDDRYAHMCPDLKVSYTLDRNEKEDSVLKTGTAKSRIWTPQSDDIVVNAAREEKKADSAKTRLDSLLMIAMAHADSTKEEPDSAMATVTPRTTMAAVTRNPTTAEVNPHPAMTAVNPHPGADTPRTVPSPPEIDPGTATKEDSKKITESFASRTAVLNKVLDVESDSVRVSFYDNGIIDGDSISVFLNQQLVLKHQELEAKALVLYLLLDSTRDINEISMFAENLGKYPPNTALMVVTDGKNRYEVFMSSSLKENATIKLRKVKPK